MNLTVTPPTPGARRAFLRNTVKLVTATFALATPVKSSRRLPQAKQPENLGPPCKGYQDTVHVRTYYEKARF